MALKGTNAQRQSFRKVTNTDCWKLREDGCHDGRMWPPVQRTKEPGKLPSQQEKSKNSVKTSKDRVKELFPSGKSPEMKRKRKRAHATRGQHQEVRCPDDKVLERGKKGARGGEVSERIQDGNRRRNKRQFTRLESICGSKAHCMRNKINENGLT